MVVNMIIGFISIDIKKYVTLQNKLFHALGPFSG